MSNMNIPNVMAKVSKSNSWYLMFISLFNISILIDKVDTITYDIRSIYRGPFRKNYFANDYCTYEY